MPGPGLQDAVIVLFFALVTLGVFLYVWHGAAPELTITGDAANIAGFAAARDHPGQFTGDELLGDADNFAFYSTVHIPVLRWLARTAGGYGQAFVWLSWPHMLLQAVGFYVLGLVLFRVRIWAAVFAFVTLWFGMMPATGEFWGLYKDPIPRVSFQALLPFVLAAAVAWRNRPGRWPWVMVVAGLLTYVHPVSSPGWGLALWCGFALCAPRAWSMGRTLGVLALNGLVYLAVTAPFIATYFGHHEQGATAQFDQVHGIMVASYSRGLLDVPYALWDFLYTVTCKFGPGTRMAAPALLLPGAVLGFVAVKRFRRVDPGAWKIVLGWVCGLVIVSGLVPLAEHTVCRWLRLIPPEISFIRGLRYLVPLGLLFCVWPAAEWHRGCESETKRRWILGAGIALALMWGAAHPPEGVARSLYRAVIAGRVTPMIPNQGEMKQAMDYLREEAPQGTRVFVYPAGRTALAVRYDALRPVVYCTKDRGAFAFGHHGRLLEWDRRRRRLAAAVGRVPARDRLQGLLPLAAALGADVVLVDNAAAPAGPAAPVFRNATYSIYALNRQATSQRNETAPGRTGVSP